MSKDTMPESAAVVSPFGTSMVDIYVGFSKIHYRVHETILCRKSDYFHKMFKGGFVETIEKTAYLPEADPALFNLFLEWIYGDRFINLDRKLSTPTSGPIIDLTKLYGFAEYMCLPDLQDCIATSVISTLRSVERQLSQGGVLQIYESCSAESGFRAFAKESLEFALTEGNQCAWKTAELTSVIKNAALAHDAVEFLHQKKSNDKSPTFSADCRFHMHGKGQACKYRFNTPSYVFLS